MEYTLCPDVDSGCRESSGHTWTSAVHKKDMMFDIFPDLWALGLLLACYTDADELSRHPYFSIRVFGFKLIVPLTFAERFLDKTRKEKAFRQNLRSVSQVNP